MVILIENEVFLQRDLDPGKPNHQESVDKKEEAFIFSGRPLGSKATKADWKSDRRPLFIQKQVTRLHSCRVSQGMSVKGLSDLSWLHCLKLDCCSRKKVNL